MTEHIQDTTLANAGNQKPTPWAWLEQQSKRGAGSGDPLWTTTYRSHDAGSAMAWAPLAKLAELPPSAEKGASHYWVPGVVQNAADLAKPIAVQAHRCDANSRSVTAFVGDNDGPLHLDGLRGLLWLGHTSASHLRVQPNNPTGTERWRVIVPYSRSISPDEHRQIWRVVRELLCPAASPNACSNPSHGYYLPPAGAQWSHGEGVLLDVNALLVMAKERGYEVLARREAEFDDEGEALVFELRADRRERIERAIADCCPPVGQRHEYRLAVASCMHRVRFSAALALDLLEGGMRRVPRGSDADLESALRSAVRCVDSNWRYGGKRKGPGTLIQQWSAKSLVDALAEDFDEFGLVPLPAGATPSNDTPSAAVAATADGGSVPAPAATVDASGLRLHPQTGLPWMVFSGDWVFLHNQDGPGYAPAIKAADVLREIDRRWYNLIQTTFRDNKQALKQLTPAELRKLYQENAALLVSTYTATANTFDLSARTMTMTALRWAPLQPTAHAHIDKWLRVLAGKAYPQLEQWLASCTKLDQAAPALYLWGASQVGKSELAHGIAQIWSVPPTELDELIADFNGASARCPITFGDEGFPEKLSFAKFRDLITAKSRRINEKFEPKRDVHGCIRMVIAANNSQHVKYQRLGTLTPDDRVGIASRLLVIKAQQAAFETIREVYTPNFRQQIAEHVLHLAQTVQLVPDGRMACRPGGADPLLNTIVIGRFETEIRMIRDATRLAKKTDDVDDQGVGVWEELAKSSAGGASFGTQGGGVIVEGRDAAGGEVPVTKGCKAGDVLVNARLLMPTYPTAEHSARVEACIDAFAAGDRDRVERRALGATHRASAVRWRVLDRELLLSAFSSLDD